MDFQWDERKKYVAMSNAVFSAVMADGRMASKAYREALTVDQKKQWVYFLCQEADRIYMQL